MPAREEKRSKPPPRPPPDIAGTFLEALPRRPPPPRYRIPLAQLLERVFGVDVLACTRCKGQMKVLVCVEKPDAVRAILRHLGLRDTPLPVRRSRGPPQPDFDFAA